MSLYERFTFRGHTLDRMTIAAVLCAEHRLGYDNYIIQGSYNRGVGASAGTHDGGGAIDIVWRPHVRREVRAFRKWGRFAIWPRPTLPGVWNRHVHGVLLGNDRCSSAAKQQWTAYRNGRDGLADNGPDRWWRPRRIRAFSYHKAGLVSYKRLNRLAARPANHRTALLRDGKRQVETVARALRGFGMDMPGHKHGTMDKPLTDALARFRKIRKIGATDVAGPLNPQTLYALCIPVKD